LRGLPLADPTLSPSWTSRSSCDHGNRRLEHRLGGRFIFSLAHQTGLPLHSPNVISISIFLQPFDPPYVKDEKADEVSCRASRLSLRDYKAPYPFGTIPTAPHYPAEYISLVRAKILHSAPSMSVGYGSTYA